MEECLEGASSYDRYAVKPPGCDNDADSEMAEVTCRPPTLRTFEDPPEHDSRVSAPKPVKRREVEAHRFSGKENVEEYLLQFELTSRRNRWDDDEQSSALLCALDGAARGILAEFDDTLSVSYTEVKQALLRRFGPTQFTEVHEQALTHLRLSKGQNVRELAHKIQRLT